MPIPAHFLFEKCLHVSPVLRLHLDTRTTCPTQHTLRYVNVIRRQYLALRNLSHMTKLSIIYWRRNNDFTKIEMSRPHLKSETLLLMNDSYRRKEKWDEGNEINERERERGWVQDWNELHCIAICHCWLFVPFLPKGGTISARFVHLFVLAQYRLTCEDPNPTRDTLNMQRATSSSTTHLNACTTTCMKVQRDCPLNIEVFEILIIWQCERWVNSALILIAGQCMHALVCLISAMTLIDIGRIEESGKGSEKWTGHWVLQHGRWVKIRQG